MAQIAPADFKRLKISGYGTINYADFNWDTDPERRAHIDVERFVVAPKYQLSDTIRLEAELEFEHGGTGITMEFDKLEEFGEFEMEVEKGGEVIVEKLAAVFEIQPELNFRMGHIIVPVGLVSKRHRPQHYFTTTRPESESNLIPTTWHENGIELFGSVGRLGYHCKLSTVWTQLVSARGVGLWAVTNCDLRPPMLRISHSWVGLITRSWKGQASASQGTMGTVRTTVPNPTCERTRMWALLTYTDFTRAAG